jgi:hypothetical protein
LSPSGATAVKLFWVLAAVAVLTALTQVGGAILPLALIAGRWFPWRGATRVLGITVMFLAIYAGASIFVVPPLAALGGRVPLPCAGEPLRTLPVLCAFNRHYANPRVVALAEAAATDVAEEFPGSVLVALDASFPFFQGFPLLPHLSHDDGNKLDLSYFYANANGDYLPATTRSPIGYWAFEQPAPGEETSCPDRWITGRWDMDVLQPLFPDLPLEPQRTRFVLDRILSIGPTRGLQRVFLEPYLARRLGVASSALGFQGCNAARHDDHIHLQIAP